MTAPMYTHWRLGGGGGGSKNARHCQVLFLPHLSLSKKSRRIHTGLQESAPCMVCDLLSFRVFSVFALSISFSYANLSIAVSPRYVAMETSSAAVLMPFHV